MAGVKQYTLDEAREMVRSFDARNLLKNRIYLHKNLTFEESYAAMLYNIAQNRIELGAYPRRVGDRIRMASQITALFSSLYMKGLKDEEMAGLCSAVFDYDIRNYLKPEVECVMDNSGMGGDLLKTPNVSTVSALLASASPKTYVCKHGSTGSTVGSSDFLEFCGAYLFADMGIVEESIQRIGFGYTDALDPQYKSIHAQSRNTIKIPHVNYVVGPVTNPVDPTLLKKRVLGVNSSATPMEIAKAYSIMNKRRVTNLRHAFFVRGLDGIDEFSIFPKGTTVAELNGKRLDVYNLEAEDFGMRPINYRSIKALSEKTKKAEFSLKLLANRIRGPARGLILANTSPLLFLSGHVKDLRDGAEMAECLLKEGRGIEQLESYVNVSSGNVERLAELLGGRL